MSFANQIDAFPEIPRSPDKDYGGIDPGKHGAISILTKSGQLIKSPFPLIGKSGKEELDLKKMGEFFRNIRTHYPNIMFIVEEVHSLFGMSAKSNFQFGFNNGLLIGMLNAMSFSYTLVQPKEWQKHVWRNADKVMMTVKGKTKTDTKSTSSKAAARIFPKEDFTPTARSKKDHDGMVDSSLLCYYGRTLNL